MGCTKGQAQGNKLIQLAIQGTASPPFTSMIAPVTAEA